MKDEARRIAADRSQPRAWRLFTLCVGLAAQLACAGRLEAPAGSVSARTDPALSDPMTKQLLEIRAEEARRRRTADFSVLTYDDEAFGADPYRVIGVATGGALGLARGAARLVRFDADLALVQSVAGPRLGTDLVASESTAFATGELASQVLRYRIDAALSPLESIEVPGAVGLTALAFGAPDVLYVTALDDSRLYLIENASSTSPAVSRLGELGRGPHRLSVVPGFLLALCLLDHSLVTWELDADGRPTGKSYRAVHDGPFWGLSAAPWHDGILIAATGVEDSPLDRRAGSFGHIDSFLYVYELRPGIGLERRLALDTSDHGVVTPRAIELHVSSGGAKIEAFGYGSASSLTLEFRGALQPELTTEPAWPGTASVTELGGRTILANPLLDAWVIERPGSPPRVLREPSRDARSWHEKLGEALAMTTLIAPRNRSEGALSRFTCETCHFEGGIDGRIHHTGRGSVRVSTKPLRGLFNNPPYFSRALDRDLTEMVHNEFRVAGAGSGADPWFSVDIADRAWLIALGCTEPVLSPARLREAVVAYFMKASHRPNPRALSDRAWSTQELDGARIFGARCEGCHEARLSTQDAASRVQFERWHDYVFSEAGPIVWASPRYQVTGIEPRVHPLGARVPSLRRIVTKFPYFTNGSARDLGAVLRGARFGEGRFCHHVGEIADSSDGRALVHPASDQSACSPSSDHLQSLNEAERSALEAFLRLL